MKTIGSLRRYKFLLDRGSLFKMYTTFLRPLLEYGGVVWDSCSNENKRTIERVQVEAPPIQNNKQLSTKLPYATLTTKGAAVLEISSTQLRRYCHSSHTYCYLLLLILTNSFKRVECAKSRY